MDLSTILPTLEKIAVFYDAQKYGHEGVEGYRKSTDLAKFLPCACRLWDSGVLDPEKTVFLDLGCADGRVNLLMSYLVRLSVGVEIDPEILREYGPRRRDLLEELHRERLVKPAGNVHLFSGDSLHPGTYEGIHGSLGISFRDVDLFYTYITLHDLFAQKIVSEAKPGARYLVYGFHKVLPRYEGLDVVDPDVGGGGIAALYQVRR